MGKGKLTISIDLELAWGVWDKLTADDLRRAEADERPICEALIALFDRHRVPATWAMVAALLDERAAASRPGGKACWYAPDVVERLRRAKVAHEIGSHGGRHIYFDRAAASAAREDLDYAKHLHRANALPFKSFVFPRNAVGHLGVLAQAGLATYRGPDVGWTRVADRAGRWASRAANFADKALPVPPQPASPQLREGLVDVPGSMLLIGRNGARRLVLPQITRAKLALGLGRARRSGGTFHLWFHPSNFYFRRQEQFDTLDWFLERAAEEAARGRVEILTMGSFAPSPPIVPQDVEAPPVADERAGAGLAAPPTAPPTALH
jgi:peptidoglycan/xylan/chitin deacetylase (PgdA/CDA1 family)